MKMKTKLNYNLETQDFFIYPNHFTPEMFYNGVNLPLRPNALIDLNLLTDVEIKNVSIDKIWLRFKEGFECFLIEYQNIDFTEDGKMVLKIHSDKTKEDYIVICSLSYYYTKGFLNFHVMAVKQILKDVDYPLDDECFNEEQSQQFTSHIKTFIDNLRNDKTITTYPALQNEKNIVVVKESELNVKNKTDIFVVGFEITM
jgi:hypothetical protein